MLLLSPVTSVNLVQKFFSILVFIQFNSNHFSSSLVLVFSKSIILVFIQFLFSKSF